MTQNSMSQGKAKPQKAAKKKADHRQTWKLLGFLLLFAGSAFLGIWAASFAFLLRLKMQAQNAVSHPLIIFDYYRVYGGQNNPAVQNAFEIAFVIAAIVAVVLPLLFIMGMQKRRSLYGDAKFATMQEVEKMNILKAEPTSVLMGKFRNRFLCYNGKQFGQINAPTRSGKGVGFVVPNLLNYQHSVVCQDIKEENFYITAGFRRKRLKQDIFFFRPFSAQTHRWNPLDYISNDPAKQVTDIIQLSYMFYPDPPNLDKNFFPAQARALFVGVVGLLKNLDKFPNGKEVKCTLGEVLRFSGGYGKALHEYIIEILEWCEQNGKVIPSAYRDKLLAYVSQSGDTRSSILGTFTGPLDLWLSKYVDNATSATDFDFRDLRRKKMTIYVGIQPKNLAEARILLNIFYSQLIMSNLDQLPEQNPDELKYQCLLLLDEFTAAGAINIINKSIAYIAGYNLRLMLIFQNKTQLNDAYGKEGAGSILANVEAMIMYTPANEPLSEAREYSEMLGYQTVKGVSKNRQTAGANRSQSENQSDQRRALMLPQELRGMPLDKEIVIMRGHKPIYADKIEYWTDPAFDGRYDMPTPPVPEWDIAHFMLESESIKLSVQNEEELAEIELAWIDGISQFLSSVEEDMPLNEQADLLAQSWAKHQGVSLAEAHQMVAQVIAELTEPEVPEESLIIGAQMPDVEETRAQMIDTYGYDLTRWTNQAVADPDIDDFALAPLPDDEVPDDADTSENGMNTFSGQ